MRPDNRRRKAKRFQVEISFASLFFWSIALIFLLGWIFVLGIMVGRGFLAEEDDNISELKTQIAKLQNMVKDGEPSHEDIIEKLDKEPKFSFYDELAKQGDTAHEKQKLASEKTLPTDKKLGEGTTALLEKGKGTPSEDTNHLEKPKLIEKKPEQKSETTKPEKIIEGEKLFTLQLASFEDEAKAKRMIEPLISKGYAAYYYKVKVKGKIFFRVRCGKFRSRDEAIAFKDNLLKKEKLSGFVIGYEK
jgi:cell division septation protein DedD